MRAWVLSLFLLLAIPGWSQDGGFKNVSIVLYEIERDLEFAPTHVNCLPAAIPLTNPPLPAGAFIISQQGAVAAGPPGTMALGFWNNLTATGSFALSIEHENDEEVGGAAVFVRWQTYAFLRTSAQIIPDAGQTCYLTGSYATGFSQAWFVSDVSRSVLVQGTSPQSPSVGDAQQTNSLNNPQWVSLGFFDTAYELGPGLIPSQARGYAIQDFPSSLIEGVVVSTGSPLP